MTYPPVSFISRWCDEIPIDKCIPETRGWEDKAYISSVLKSRDACGAGGPNPEVELSSRDEVLSTTAGTWGPELWVRVRRRAQ